MPKILLLLALSCSLSPKILHAASRRAPTDSARAPERDFRTAIEEMPTEGLSPEADDARTRFILGATTLETEKETMLADDYVRGLQLVMGRLEQFAKAAGATASDATRAAIAEATEGLARRIAEGHREAIDRGQMSAMLAELSSFTGRSVAFDLATPAGGATAVHIPEWPGSPSDRVKRLSGVGVLSLLRSAPAAAKPAERIVKKTTRKTDPDPAVLKRTRRLIKGLTDAAKKAGYSDNEVTKAYVAYGLRTLTDPGDIAAFTQHYLAADPIVAVAELTSAATYGENKRLWSQALDEYLDTDFPEIVTLPAHITLDSRGKDGSMIRVNIHQLRQMPKGMVLYDIFGEKVVLGIRRTLGFDTMGGFLAYGVPVHNIGK